MKSSTLNTLLVAKTLWSEASYLVNVGNKHSCTAGLILLQDFVELIVLAALDELDCDEHRNLESKSFDELLGELRRQGVPIFKSGTIKALNKQRVISKHFGQLSEPSSVINYLKVAEEFVDRLLEHVVGKKLIEVFLTDVLLESEAKAIIKKSILLSVSNNFLDALIELRKAFFVAYEYQYCVYAYRNLDENEGPLSGLFMLGISGGRKAHYWTRNKNWIEKNVKKPTDYLQMNHDQLKTDCMEFGVNTVEIQNFRRLTPELVRTESDAWHYEYTSHYLANELTSENYNYCLDILINFLLKKQELDASHRYPKSEKSIPAPPIYVGKSVLSRPDKYSPIVGTVQDGYYYSVDRVVTGFDSGEQFLYVHLYPAADAFSFDKNIWGYLPMEED